MHNFDDILLGESHSFLAATLVVFVQMCIKLCSARSQFSDIFRRSAVQRCKTALDFVLYQFYSQQSKCFLWYYLLLVFLFLLLNFDDLLHSKALPVNHPVIVLVLVP